MALTDRQAKFVDEYLVDLNATQACIRAGYSAKSADKIGHELLGKTGVSEAIAKRMKDRERRTEITQDYVLNTIRSTVERCSQAEPVTDSEGNPTGEYKFDASNVLKGCELMGKHLAMWTDKQQHSGDVGLTVKVTRYSDA